MGDKTRNISRFDTSFVPPNVIHHHPENLREDLSREEKAERARLASERRAQRYREQAVPLAKARLRKMSAVDAAQFVDGLAHREKFIYAQAEAEDQGRVTVLRKLQAYLPTE